MYKIIRATNKKLIGNRIEALSLEEVVAYLEELYGKFTKVTTKGNKIKLRDSNLMIVVELCEEGE